MRFFTAAIRVTQLVLLEIEKLLYLLYIALVEDCEVVEIPLLLLGLLRENVAVVGVSPLDLACPGKLETLFGTWIRL